MKLSSRKTSRLALGTVQFGLPYGVANLTGKVSIFEASKMLTTAKKNSILTLDTAVSYGESEKSLGEIGVKDFKLVTKIPEIPKSCNDIDRWINDQFTKSSNLLGEKKIYSLLLHRPGQLLEPIGKRIYRSLQLLKESGKITKLGISVYSPNELENIVPRFKFDLIQAPFNLIDRRLSSSGWLKRLKDKEIEIHTRSTFLQGLLLMPYSRIPKEFSRWTDLWHAWHTWLLNNNLSSLEASLNFPLSFPEIDKILVGADSNNHLSEIISAVKTELKSDFPDISSENEDLINPSRWNKI